MNSSQTNQTTERLSMEFFEPACPWHIRIGDLFISPSRVPNNGKIWIGDVNTGEGGEFDAEKLAPMLLKFYQDNF